MRIFVPKPYGFLTISEIFTWAKAREKIEKNYSKDVALQSVSWYGNESLIFYKYDKLTISQRMTQTKRIIFKLYSQSEVYNKKFSFISITINKSTIYSHFVSLWREELAPEDKETRLLCADATGDF